MTHDEINQAVKENRVVLFMKGNKMMPSCGFSARVVDILTKLKTDFVTFDVLKSDDLRQNIKDFSSWPTLPQLYIDGEFVGGCDIVTQLYESGDLAKMT